MNPLSYFPNYDKLNMSVEKRMITDRPIGCLLSGGLDSSIIASIMSKRIKNLKTYSIGLNGSPDLYHAENVANYLKTICPYICLGPNDISDYSQD